MQFRIEENTLRDVESRLGQFTNQAPNVIARSLNRAVKNVATNIPKEAREKYHIKQGDIVKGSRGKKAIETFKASRSQLTGEVKVSGAPIPLDRFKVTPKTVNRRRKKQLNITIKKGDVKQITGAFVANMNGIKVFKRQTKSRLPIERLFSVSVPQMVDDDDAVGRILEKGWDTYKKRLDHEVNYLLTRLGAK